MPRISPSGSRASRTAGCGRSRCSRKWRGSRPRWSTTCSTPSPRATPKRAAAVIERDAAVDDFYNSIFRSLLTHMMENPHNITPGHPSPVRRPQPGADRRPCHQRRRDGLFRRDRRISRRPPQGRRHDRDRRGHDRDRRKWLRAGSCWSRTTGRWSSCSSIISSARGSRSRHRRRRGGLLLARESAARSSSSSTGCSKASPASRSAAGCGGCPRPPTCRSSC